LLFFCQIVGGLFFLDALFGLLVFFDCGFHFSFLSGFDFFAVVFCFSHVSFCVFQKVQLLSFLWLFFIFFRLFFVGRGFSWRLFLLFFFILSGDLTISTVSTLYGTLWAQLNVLYM